MADAFQPRFVDLVRNYTTTTGTGNFTLGPAVNGFAGFAAALSPGDSFYYSAIGVDKPAETEVGRGTLQADGTISRDPVTGTKTNFTTGTKSLALIAAAEWFTDLETAKRINVKAFGAVGDGVADDSAAFVAALAYLKSIAVNQGVYYQGSPRLFVPAGLYNMGTTTLDITHTLIIEGDSSINGYSSRLKWTGNATGIRVQAYNTSGAADVVTPGYNSGSYTIIRGIALAGPYDDYPNFTGKSEGEFHGIHARSNVIIEDVSIDGFAGDGLHAQTSVGGGTGVEGNSNCSFVNRLRVANVRNGVYLDGADANAWTLIGVIGTYCRQHTVWDSSFLGNTHIGHHSANAGLIPGTPATVVSYLGNRYSVVQGQAAGASTNAPSGTTADNTYWYYLYAGDVASWLNIPSWSSGISVREGGGYRTDSANGYNAFIGCYQEGGEAWSQFTFPTAKIGGVLTPKTTGNIYDGHQLVAPNNVTLGPTRVITSNTTRLTVHNGSALSGGLKAQVNFAVGYEADGVTPLVLATMYAYSGTATPATAEGVLVFQTRTYGGTGGQTDRMILDGVNLALRPATDNNMSLGSSGLRWKKLWAYASDVAGPITATGAITSSSATAGIGYATGAGGTVTQATSRTTGVTLNRLCGQITLVSAAGSSTWQTFTVTNSTVAATDVIRVVQKSGTDKYLIHVTNVAAGSFQVTFATTGGATTEQPAFNFAVLKAVSA